MRYGKTLAVATVVLCSLVALAKNKQKILLPADVLQARTVLIVVDPDAGISPDAPTANQTARNDVEKAILNWGRFDLAMDASTADLIFTVRKGSGKVAQPTIGGVPNNGPVIFNPSGSSGNIGIHSGTPPMGGDQTQSSAPNPHPQAEIGPADDMIVLYRGKRDDPLSYPPVWRYTARDALRSPDVPAVDVFKDLVIKAVEQQRQQSTKP